MVERDLALGVLQLVALSLPAFAILLEIVVESDFPLTKEAVPLTTAGFGLFLTAGIVDLAALVITTDSLVLQVWLGLVGLGLVSLLVGTGIIGSQIEAAQEQDVD
jgi:hypothetical protein